MEKVWRKLNGEVVRQAIADEIREVIVREMEIHADINTMRFSFRAKPFAFASSCCANKVVQ